MPDLKCVISMMKVGCIVYVLERSFLHLTVSWMGGGWGGELLKLLNRTSAVMLLKRTGGVVFAQKPPVGSCT